MKTQYSTSFIQCFQLGLLSKSEKQIIPYSTRRNWKNKKMDSVIGRHILLPEYTESDILKLVQQNIQYRRTIRILMVLLVYYRKNYSGITIKKSDREQVRNNWMGCCAYIQKLVPVKTIIPFINLPYGRYRYWKNKKLCESSCFILCRKQHPQQLSNKECEAIKKYVQNPEYRNWSLSSIFYQMMKDANAFCSLSTFYKYVIGLQLCFKKPKLYKPVYEKIISSSPLEKLHVDTTIVKLIDQKKVYITFIMDNYSRAILGYKAALEHNASNTTLLLKEVFVRHDLKCLSGSIIVDGGSEFKGLFAEYINATGYEKIIAQKDILQSNSPIEALNKIMKYRFLYQHQYNNLEGLNEYLKTAVPTYQKIPKAILYGESPEDVLKGTKPDKKKYEAQLTEARKTRIASNRATKCCLEKLPILDG